MKKFLGLGLALSLLLNAVLLLRRSEPTPPVLVRTQVVERPVASEPQPSQQPPAESIPGPLPEPRIIVLPSPSLPDAAPVFAPAPHVSLVASPSDVGSGGRVTLTCTVISGIASARHWIGLYVRGAEAGPYSAYLMVHPHPEYVFKAPRAPGEYEFRYILEDDKTSIAASNPFRVYDEPAARTLVDLQSGITYVGRGGEIPAAWSLLTGRRSPQDWIGLYAPGAKNEEYLTWKYVTDADHGRVLLKAPDQPGTYEMRYLLDNGYESVATSVRIVVLP